MATGERATATVASIDRIDHNYYEFTVELNGKRKLLLYGWTKPTEEVGEDIEVVIDPTDPGVVFAVGTPESWDPDRTHDLFMFLLLPGLALFGTGWVAVKLIPEDLERLGRLGQRKPVPGTDAA